MTETILNRLRNGLVRTTKQSMEIICLKASLTSSTVELSSTSDDPKKSSDADRIDRELMAYLIHRKMINWCDKTCRLAPLKNDQTSGSGLLRAVGSSIWGLHDEATDSFLRRLLHVALTSGKQQPTFKERWQLEQDKASFNSDSHGHSKDAWEDVYSAFQGNEFEVAEEDILADPIHLFSLSNILRRPILVLGDVPSATSRPSIRDLTGIYLPLLSSAESCVPYPLVLVRHEGHFRALLVNRVSLEWWQVQSFRSVPLVRVDQEPFHIRCLLTSESRRVRELLLSYLNIAEISYTTPSGTFQVLTCRLSTEKPLLESPESEGVFANAAPIRIKPFSESCLVTDEAPGEEEGEGLRLSGATSRLEGSGCVRNCIACQTIRRAEQRKLTSNRPQSESEARSVRRTYSTRCENVQCRKEGSQKYGGRCYACYVVKDPWLEVSNGEEQLRNLRAMNREKDLVCPKVEEMQELTVADSMKDSRKAKDMDDAAKHRDRIVETEVKDTEKLVRVKNTHEPAKFIHRHEPEHVKDKSAKVKGKEESENNSGDSDTVPVSTPDTDVRDLTKSNGNAKTSKYEKSENATRAGDPVKASYTNESVVGSNTHEATNDPQPTAEHLMTSGQAPGLGGDSEERQSAGANKCIVDFCSNAAENAYRGLCMTCYQTLARHRTPRDPEEQIVRPDPSSTTVASVQCLMEGCEGPVTNQQLGLCLSCLRMQIFAARDLERKKEQRRSLLRHSENPIRTAKVDPSTIVLPEERSSKKERIPKSPSEVHAAQVPSPPTLQRNGTARLNYSSPRRTKAKCCLTSDCDRYGDPSFDGYCSLCYERLSPGLLVPRC